MLYGGVYDYLKNELPRFGVEVTFADFEKEDIASLIRPNTKLLYTETISNPLMAVEDLPKIAKIAHAHGCKLMVDNTFATPAVAQPLKLGADIVVYSATKYLNGHSDIIGGAVLSDAETIAQVHRCFTLYGAIMGPFEAWLLTRSLRTLDMRMGAPQRQCPEGGPVPGKAPQGGAGLLPRPGVLPYHKLAMELFRDGRCGGMLSADIAGGEKGACDFIRACESIKFVPSLAGVATSISYPAKTSHRAYSPEEMAKVGISMGQLRFSIGLENADDIIEELDNALRHV